MADINSVVLVGRVVRDAELRYSPSGTPVCKFSLAVNRDKREGDSWSEEVNFFDIVLFGRLGEAVARYLVKGKQVAVQGELRQDRWEREGQTVSRVEIVANNLRLLGGGGTGGGQDRPAPSGGGASTPPAAGEPDFEDDIPF
ncbi:single-stranded DNA-binding protein [Spirochaeta thermophila]|uniref:Single-stranded DNA-binding protein n=1 Tax=Winmispira thermophila (strain ATCC 49972 / DSM 6192 / RI 19.B1) TaxID=665571 RepID=E0RTM8_WINT6|nr:single-stranded DNA-binding protein [Spirochaeta thermophila]ADN02259.1 single-strand binding protein [Spirochaeta thermophila DSM 6192]